MLCIVLNWCLVMGKSLRRDLYMFISFEGGIDDFSVLWFVFGWVRREKVVRVWLMDGMMVGGLILWMDDESVGL